VAKTQLFFLLTAPPNASKIGDVGWSNSCTGMPVLSVADSQSTPFPRAIRRQIELLIPTPLLTTHQPDGGAVLEGRTYLLQRARNPVDVSIPIAPCQSFLPTNFQPPCAHTFSIKTSIHRSPEGAFHLRLIPHSDCLFSSTLPFSIIIFLARIFHFHTFSPWANQRPSCHC
jgi:hypothetical protein